MTSLTGTARLVRLALRRDRIRLAAWLIGVTGFTVLTAGGLGSLYATEENRADAAATMSSPAGLASTGPARYLDDYHFGAMMAHQVLGWTAVLVAIMSILIVVRHSRSEEESGLAELIRSAVVGRHAHLVAALAVAVVANLAMALLLTAGMGVLGLEGVTWSGSLLYGLAHAGVGLVFAAVAAVTAQISAHPRGAAGLGFAGLGLAFMLRAMGDAGGGELSWLSPIGWAQRTYVYVDDRWWPLLLGVGATVLLVGAGMALSTRRDVGAGLRQARLGRPAASAALRRPVGLALRLHRGLLLGFTVGLALLGASYGSVMADVQEMLSGMDLIEDALAEVGGANMVESFASVIMVVMAVITSVYLVMATLRARTEENTGRAEPLLSGALSQPRWLASHVTVALLGGVAVMGAAGLAFGLVTAAVLGDDALVGDFAGAALAYVPALWVVAGVAVALFGAFPRLAVLSWLMPLYGFVVAYLGQILQFPDWMMNLSPFGHVPRLPAQPMEWLPLAVMCGVAAVLMAIGMVGFRRRDLLSTV